MKHSIYYLLLLTLILNACKSGKNNDVVVYTSVDQVFSEPVLKDFEKETGIQVKMVFDTEEAKSTGVMNRLIAEKENPQCDVFWSGDPIRADLLKQKGITTPYESPVAEDISPIFKDKDNHWTGFSARVRVLLYNMDSVKVVNLPLSINDLTLEKYHGKFAIANPLFGTTSFHVAALFTLWGDNEAMKWLEGIKKNGVVLATSNGDVKKKVMTGEVIMGLTDTDDANEAIKEGGHVKMIFLDQQGIGNLINPNTVSLIVNSPNQDNGRKLIDYLLSKQTEEKLAKSCAQMPLHKGVPVPETVPVLDNIVPMKIDYETTARKLDEIKSYLKTWAEQ
jgi:iron(III) transport system substrate-binding protein